MFGILAPIGIDDRALQQCADIREAMRRSGWLLKQVAVEIDAPESKLCDQLNGRQPFTYLWRFSRLDDRFWNALDDVRAERRGVMFLDSPDLVSLLQSVRVIGRFVKAHLPERDERQVG